jgi:phosphoenolpyruvate carboxylase
LSSLPSRTWLCEKVFGLCLLRLDVRQHSERHSEALAEITQYLGLGNYLEWDEPARMRFLQAELNSRRPLLPWVQFEAQAGAPVREVLATFRLLANVEPEWLGAYVVSMAHAASDVLAVQLLLKEAGAALPPRVVPLFETKADLEKAPEVLRQLLGVDAYRSAIRGTQEVMLGYSDSAKDAGRLTRLVFIWTCVYVCMRGCKLVCECVDMYVLLLKHNNNLMSFITVQSFKG